MSSDERIDMNDLPTSTIQGQKSLYPVPIQRQIDRVIVGIIISGVIVIDVIQIILYFGIRYLSHHLIWTR